MARPNPGYGTGNGQLPNNNLNSNSNQNSSNNNLQPRNSNNSDQTNNEQNQNKQDQNNQARQQENGQKRNDGGNSRFADLDRLRNRGPADLGSIGGKNDGGTSKQSPFDDLDNDKDKDDYSGDSDNKDSKNPDKSDNDLDGDSDNKKSDNSNDSDDPNSDLDDQNSKDNNSDNQNPISKMLDKLKEPLAKGKHKHFGDFLNDAKRRHGDDDSPGQRAKNLLQKILRLIKRLIQLFKIYTEALRLFMLFKMVMLLQTLASWALNVLNFVITFVVSLWTAAVGFLGTIGASIMAFLMGGFILVIAGLIAGLFGWFSQMQQQQRAAQEYYQICVVQHGHDNPEDDGPNAGGGSGGDWTKKGTKAYKNAKAVFDAFINRGFSGTAAAAVVGWVQSEGGFSIIDRAQGHFGDTEKDNGVSEGVEPIGGGAGIFQFTPYDKFAPLGSKKWLSAKAQIDFVLKSIKSGDWNTQYSNGLSIKEFAKSSGSPAPIWKGWDGYERGNEQAVAAAAPTKKADMKTAYRVFHGSKYSFNAHKYNKFMGSGASNGGVTDTNEAADSDSSKGIDPRCGNIKNHNDDDDTVSNDIVKTAQKEIDAGKHTGGGKYLSWFGGFPAGTSWCAIFVSWVLHHTKGYEYVPKNASVAGFASYFKAHHEYKSYTERPKPGWIIMFDWSGGHNPTDHIGIVKAVHGNKITTLEGNNGDQTVEKTYNTVGGKDIAGYGVLKKK